MPWFFIDIQLEVLIVHQETTTLLVDGEMWLILLRKMVDVVTMRDLRFYFDNLTTRFALPAHSVNVTEIACKHEKRTRGETAVQVCVKCAQQLVGN